MHWLRLEDSFREQARSHGSAHSIKPCGSLRCPVGADLSAKRAVHSMHWLRLEDSFREQARSHGSAHGIKPCGSLRLRLEYSLREQVRSYGSTRYLVGARTA